MRRTMKKFGSKLFSWKYWSEISTLQFCYRRKFRDKTYKHINLGPTVRDQNIMTCHDISWHVTKISWHIMTCHDIDMTCHDMSWHIIWYLCHDISWYVMICHDMSWYFFRFCWNFMGFWHFMTCRDMSWHVMTCHFTYYDMSWHIMTCYS